MSFYFEFILNFVVYCLRTTLKLTKILRGRGTFHNYIKNGERFAGYRPLR